MNGAAGAIRVVAVMEAYSVTGPARNLLRFCRQLSKAPAQSRRINMSIATFIRGDDPSNEFTEAVRAAGIELDIIRERRRFDWNAIRGLRAVLERRDPHIVQTHGVKAHLLAMLLRSRGTGRRWVAYHHGYTREDLKMRIYNNLNRFTLPRADHVITVCEPFASALVHTGVKASRISVVPNAIDPVTLAGPEQAAVLRRQLHIAPDDRVVLVIGRFSAEKAQGDMVPAFMRVLQNLPDDSLRLVFVGDGIERNNVANAFASKGIADRVRFVGHQKNVGAFYAMADVFVLPSHSEGSPNVILEAMAAGLPIVATAVGGVPEIVRDRHSGLLIPPADPERLAEAIVRLLSDAELAAKLAANAREEVRARFSPDVFNTAIIGIYNTVHSACA